MALVTVQEFMGAQGGTREVLISTNHIVSVTPSAAHPGYNEVHVEPTAGGKGFFLLDNAQLTRLKIKG